MSRVFLHSKNDEKKNILLTVFLLIPFLLFGFYKNGISLYQKNIISLFLMFKPLLLSLISIGVSLGYSLLFHEDKISYRLLTNFIISLVTFPMTNILFYMVLLVGINFLSKYLKANPVAIYMIIYILISLLFRDYSFFNDYEMGIKLNYFFSDYLFGKGFGGISNTLLIYTFICMIIFLFNTKSKKEYVLAMLITYYLLLFMTAFIVKGFNNELFLNNNLLFASIFILPINVYSPYTRGAGLLLGVILGVLLYISSFLDINIGLYLCLLLASLFFKLFDDLIVENKK